MASDEKRLTQLKADLALLKEGKNVSTQEIERRLLPEELDEFESRIKYYEDEDKLHADEKGIFTRYNEKLKEACFTYAKYDALSQKTSRTKMKSSPSVNNLFNQSDRLFEDAKEILDEILQKGKSLERILDRPYDPTCDLVPESMPRLRSSKSRYNQAPYEPDLRARARELKEDMITKAIEALKEKMSGPQPSSDSSGKSIEGLRKLLGE